MTNETPTNAECLGYLLVHEEPEGTLVGGYLLVCLRGRPIEFHCTEPVRATRAQQILFGPTLRSYLVAEVIGQTLLGAASRKPAVLLVEEPAALPLASSGETQAVLLANVPREELPDALENYLGGDLAEPFERIREAIAETRRLAVESTNRDAA
ncbi:hypothetical protein [Botrimarina hoheduenensis]|uniref:Uncharacterized protein n=1 Tax=Botrimarina hoheduenensis TaxID=2528000 RepID=A0A5C5VYR6_9BACT|nr:hypothetical protein [Botrimarina hoheduenensis]TWT43257.1 hypothetical protein Pla111_22070 [Botrimarina hoheduenensis]